MPTKMTARIPVTPAAHADLRRVKDESGADTFDALVRALIIEYEIDGRAEDTAQSTTRR